jgi:hypothetical protein
MKQGKPTGGRQALKQQPARPGLYVLPLQLDAVYTLLLCKASCIHCHSFSSAVCTWPQCTL